MKKNRSIRLYNVMFPIWFFYFFPVAWVLILPVNFAVDSLVILLSARCQKLVGLGGIWKKHILPVWGFGFLADLLGAAVTFGIYLLTVESTSMNVHFFPGATLISIPGVVLAGVLIYFFNKKVTFRRSELDPIAIHRLCLHLAIFTAPYTMLIPLYG